MSGTANPLAGSAASLDTSIPLRAGQGVTPMQNPLTTMGQFMQLRALQNQNQLFPGEQQIQQQTIQKGDLDINKAQRDNSNASIASFGALYAPLLQKDDPSLDDVTNIIANGHVMGNPDADKATLMAHQSFPVNGTAGDRRNWVRAIVSQTLSPADRVGALVPGAKLVSDGKTDNQYSVAPMLSDTPGVMAPISGAASITRQLSPSEATAPTKIGVDGKGRDVFGTHQQFIDKATSSPSPFGDGRLPSALRGPNAPKPAGIVTSLSPSESAAQTETGGSSAKAFNDYADQGVASKTRAAALDNMLGDTANFTTGPMADQIAKLRAVAQRFHVNVDADALSSAESFNKLAAQLAAAQSGGTDKSLGNSMAANPHIDLSPNGVDMMLRQLRGNEDYLQARSQLAASYPDKSDRAGFEAKTGAQLDPRVFQYERMTPDQKGTFLNSMKDPSAFIKAHKWAESQRLIGG